MLLLFGVYAAVYAGVIFGAGGDRIGAKWEGMPYHGTLGHPGWWIKAAQVEVG